jgi:hypothetical protein
MNDISKCAVVLSITLVALPLFAAAKTTPETTPDKDYGKLSTDGSKVLRDVGLARLAIFDGQLAEAKRYTDEAQTAIDRAKGDDTVFTKAEADLKAPAGKAQPGSGTASTTPTKWIPIDGSMTLGEDYTATPEKSAGVSKANEQLKKGDHEKAMETLKLANVDVSFVMEVAPLEKTTSGINHAAQLLNEGKYYEANQALKSVEDGFRFDVSDVDSAPNSDMNKTSAMNNKSEMNKTNQASTSASAKK